MLMCDEAITLVRHIEEQDADTYTCTVIHGASWYTTEKTMLQEHGFVKQSETKSRIPEGNMPEGITLVAGDWMVRGIVEEITKPADLQTYEHIRIMSVGDNRRGGLPHWVVTGQ